jgi:tetratricopeptide (TPR) repeat protein
MTQKSSFFTLPLGRFDLSQLSPESRTIGSDEFKQAVLEHFAKQYAQQGQQAVVFVDDEIISVLVVPESEDPFDFVLTMLQSGQIKEAIPFLEAMAKERSDNVGILYNLGVAYSEIEEFEEAIIRLKRAVKLAPLHAHAWTAIGVAYQRMGEHDKAIDPARKAVEADPADGYAQRNLGALLLGLSRFDEALVHLRIARKSLPKDPQTLYGLACALENTEGSTNEDEADELYQVVIQIAPGSKTAGLAKAARTRIGHKNMRNKVDGGLRPDVVMYILGALKTFKEIGPRKAHELTLEIALKGQSGLDINNPEQKYTLKSLPGNFSGMHLLSIMYAGFKAIDPTMDAGVDLSAEYDAALSMHSK